MTQHNYHCLDLSIYVTFCILFIPKEIESLRHKIKFSNPYIFANLSPNISNIDYFIYSLKYLKVRVLQRERDYKIRFCGNN